MGIQKNGRPTATSFMTTVEVPVSKLIVDNSKFAGVSTYDASVIFCEMADEAYDSVLNHDCKICQFILRWASSCEATLEGIENSHSDSGEKTVNFTFSFTAMMYLMGFVRDLRLISG